MMSDAEVQLFSSCDSKAFQPGRALRRLVNVRRHEDVSLCQQDGTSHVGHM